MRLIDADKLHYKRVLLNDCTQSAVVVFAKEIDKAKKIKAIPIEWIERIIKEGLCDQYARWEDISAQVDTNTMMKSLAILIERWEKENE